MHDEQALTLKWLSILSALVRFGDSDAMLILDEQAERKTNNQQLRQLASLKSKRFGKALSDTEQHILNLSEYKLSNLDRFVLSHRLRFGLPLKSVNKQQTFAEFESLWARLQLHHAAVNNEQRDSLKARLADLANIYCESKPDNHDIAMQKQWFSAINKLQRNDSIIITKPDKSSGVVILNKSDYTNKMNNILHDETKFERIGPASTCDNTHANESRLHKRLLELFRLSLFLKKFLPDTLDVWTA